MNVDRTDVLFLCTGNACRSQMAEGLLRCMGKDRFRAFSAGTHPSGLNRLAVKAMKELNIDISGQSSKRVETFSGRRFDFVITVCDSAKTRCPVFPAGTHHLHWSFKDPAEATGSEGDKMKVFRAVRDGIGREIERFLETRVRRNGRAPGRRRTSRQRP